jgi:hypothetical protein
MHCKGLFIAQAGAKFSIGTLYPINYLLSTFEKKVVELFWWHLYYHLSLLSFIVRSENENQ